MNINYINYRCLFVFLLLTQSIFPSQLSAALPDTGRVGEIQWKSSALKPPISLNDAVQRASDYIGIARTIRPDDSRLVQVNDNAPYDGNAVTVSLCWLLHYSNVPIFNSNNSETKKVSLNVLIYTDSSQKFNLLAVFTDRNREAWVDRNLSERQVYNEIEEDGWTLSTAEQYIPNAKVTDIISAFWVNTGIDPDEMGRLLMRPRIVSLAFPAAEKNRRLTPVYPTGLYWTAQLFGTKTAERVPPGITNTDDIEYMTGLVKLINDITHRVVRGVYLP